MSILLRVQHCACRCDFWCARSNRNWTVGLGELREGGRDAEDTTCNASERGGRRRRGESRRWLDPPPAARRRRRARGGRRAEPGALRPRCGQPPDRDHRRRPGRADLRVPTSSRPATPHRSTRDPTASAGAAGRCRGRVRRRPDRRARRRADRPEPHPDPPARPATSDSTSTTCSPPRSTAPSPSTTSTARPYSFAQATDDLKGIWQQIHSDVSAASYPTLYNLSTQRGRELDAMSITDWINAYVPGGMSSKLGPAARRRLQHRVRGRVQRAELAQHALPARLRRARGTCGSSASRTRSTTCAGATTRFPTRLAAALAGQITTNRALTAISRNADGSYSLTFVGRSRDGHRRPRRDGDPVLDPARPSTTRRPASRRAR